MPSTIWASCCRTGSFTCAASNKAPLTIDPYLVAGEGLHEFLRATGMPTAVHDLPREHIEAYLISIEDRRLAPATVAKTYRSLQQLFRWLVEDGEIDRSPFERMRPPAVPEQPVDVLTEEELGRLLATCNGQTLPRPRRRHGRRSARGSSERSIPTGTHGPSRAGEAS